MSSSSHSPLVWIVSGPSGSGKTSLCAALLKDRAWRSRLLRSVSYTTRPLRSDEKEGRDYITRTEKDFQALIRRGELLEYQKIFGAYYGTPRRVIDQARRQGKDVLLCIDVKGAQTVRRQLARNVASIFIAPPSIRALTTRLSARATEDKKAIHKRMSRVKIELSYSRYYDYIVVNDDFDDALGTIKSILTAKRREGAYVRTTGKTQR